MSVTVTVKVHVPVSPAASVAVHVTTVEPSGNEEPGAGKHATVAPGQLSLAAGSVKFTVAAHVPAPAGCVTFAGHVRVGAWVSATVTVNEHDASGRTPLLAVQLTVDEPTGKSNGDVMTVRPIWHVTVGVGDPVAVGANATEAVQTPVSALVETLAGQVIVGGS